MRGKNYHYYHLNGDNFRAMMLGCPSNYGAGTEKYGKKGLDLKHNHGWAVLIGEEFDNNMSAKINGKRSISEDALEKIVAVSGCSQEYLLGESHYRTKKEEKDALLAAQKQRNIAFLDSCSNHQNMIELCLIDDGISIEALKRDNLPTKYRVNGIEMNALQYGRYLILMDKAMQQASENYFAEYQDILYAQKIDEEEQEQQNSAQTIQNNDDEGQQDSAPV